VPAPPAAQEAAAGPHPGQACLIHGNGHDAEHGRDEEQC
jgi:hypothetical protein